MKVYIRTLLIALSSIFVFTFCASDQNTSEDFDISVRMKTDPGKLNPLAGTPSIASTDINNLLFLPLADYDPRSLELSPILVKEIAEPRTLENGGIAFDYEFLEDAVWDDGQPITAEDYLFTLKVIMNPNAGSAALRGAMSAIDSVYLDQENEKKFSVIFNEYFYLAQEVSCKIDILPKHIYDPGKINDKYSLNEVINSDSSDVSLSNFAKEFTSIAYTQDTISGAGPYRMKTWEVDQYLVLEEKDNYWGDKYPERTRLAHNPSSITFRMIQDDNAAATLLKDGSIDLLTLNDATVFSNLKNGEGFGDRFNVAAPPISLLYYITLNNRVPELSDKNVRRALAHLVDVDNIIENLEDGYGVRQPGTIMPNWDYFNKDLELINYDLEKAVEILESEGWEDTNGNGIRDKEINGKLTELEVEYLASKSPLGQKVGLLFQDKAKEAGVAVKMEVKEGRIMTESIYNHEYESAASAVRFGSNLYDPYQRWHSDNSTKRKGNFAGYTNERNDELIELIRTERDPQRRKEAYLEFQKLMYEEQPVIFLYSPTQKFVLNNKYKGLFSMQRPGYFVGSFELAGESKEEI